MLFLTYNVVVALIYLILITELHHDSILKVKKICFRGGFLERGVHMYKGVNLSLLIFSHFS